MKEKDESKMAMTYQTKAIERVKEVGLGYFYGKGELISSWWIGQWQG